MCLDKKISIVLPVYNVEKYLRRCFDSILNQTYSNYEVVVINDGSTDKSGEICDEYAAKHQAFRVYHQVNTGVAVARRRGIENANSDYIACVDSDDYLHPDYLQAMVSKIGDYDIVRVNYLVGNESDAFDCKKIEQAYEGELSIFREDFVKNFFLEKNLIASFWGTIIPKDYFEKVDMCSGATIGEDVCAMSQIYELADSICVLSSKLYYYWQNDEGISRGGFTDGHIIGLDNYIRYCELFCEKYPSYRGPISSFFIEYEMAVMTAMSRDWRFDKPTIIKLRNHIRCHKKEFLRNKNTAIFYKISALMILGNYKLFAFCFNRIRYLVGR